MAIERKIDAIWDFLKQIYLWIFIAPVQFAFFTCILKDLKSKTQNSWPKHCSRPSNLIKIKFFLVFLSQIDIFRVVSFKFSLIHPFLIRDLFGTLTVRGKKWCTIDIWWLIYMFCESFWCFLKWFSVNFHWWSDLIVKKFLWHLYNKKKIDVLLNFEDSRVLYVNKIDLLKSSFELVFFNGATVPKTIFSRNFSSRGKTMMCNWNLMALI